MPKGLGCGGGVFRWKCIIVVHKCWSNCLTLLSTLFKMTPKSDSQQHPYTFIWDTLLTCKIFRCSLIKHILKFLNDQFFNKKKQSSTCPFKSKVLWIKVDSPFKTEVLRRDKISSRFFSCRRVEDNKFKILCCETKFIKGFVYIPPRNFSTLCL